MNCQQCGGFIMQPNQNYGYSGPVCHCPKYIQPVNPFTGQIVTRDSDTELKRQVRFLLDAIIQAKPHVIITLKQEEDSWIWRQIEVLKGFVE